MDACGERVVSNFSIVLNEWVLVDSIIYLYMKEYFARIWMTFGVILDWRATKFAILLTEIYDCSSAV